MWFRRRAHILEYTLQEIQAPLHQVEAGIEILHAARILMKLHQYHKNCQEQNCCDHGRS
jgi:hypothetical protein